MGYAIDVCYWHQEMSERPLDPHVKAQIMGQQELQTPFLRKRRLR